jgi:hypothetical protein
VVADGGNHRTQVMRYSDGQHLRTIGQQGSGNGQFNSPHGVAFDGAGHLVVVEHGNHRVQVLNYADGSHVRAIGSKGSDDGQFDSPYGGVAIDSDGRIVCDTDNNRIQVLQCCQQFPFLPCAMNASSSVTLASSLPSLESYARTKQRKCQCAKVKLLHKRCKQPQALVMATYSRRPKTRHMQRSHMCFTAIAVALMPRF